MQFLYNIEQGGRHANEVQVNEEQGPPLGKYHLLEINKSGIQSG